MSDCIACKAKSNILEEFATQKIIECYRVSLGIDVSAEFEGVARMQFLKCTECALEFFSPPKAGSNSFYNRLNSNDWYFTPDRTEFLLAAKYINQTDDVLDVGSGAGTFTHWINPKSYVGLELNPPEKRIKNYNPIAQTLEEHIKQEKKIYSVVCAFQVLEHISEPGSFLAQMKSCLSPSGLIIISVPNTESFMGSSLDLALNLPPHHVSRWRKETFTYLSKILGLKIIKCEIESLQKEHQILHTKNIIQHSIYRFLRVTLTSKLFSPPISAANFIDRLSSFLAKYKKIDRPHLITGHTLTIVAQNNG